MFPYSERKRTRAALFPGKVAASVIQQRKRALLTLAEQQAFALREQYVGQTLTVLLESEEKNSPSVFSGHTDNFLPVHVEGQGLFSNQIVKAFITHNTPQALVGRRVE
jgi:threonylcarbamoyladenosine tRNA methylthiotransferase MtaB